MIRIHRLKPPVRWPGILGQVCAYALFVAFIGVLSNSPSYRHMPPDQATIKLSLRHAGKLLGECRERSAQELADLPPNMRIALVCPRERSPIVVELDLNGQRVFSETLPARGIHQDGRASTYRRFSVPAGQIQLAVRLKDHIGSKEFHYTATHTTTLEPAQVLVIDFNEQARSFEFL